MQDENGNETQDGSTDNGTVDPHTIEGARAAGAYNNAPGAHAPQNDDPVPGGVQADVGAAENLEGDHTDDDGRITSQQGREAAGAFTGTGNQDAMRTSGRLGDTDAHAADTRTVEGGADERTQDDAGDRSANEGGAEEGQAADQDDGREGENRRFGSLNDGGGEPTDEPDAA